MADESMVKPFGCLAGLGHMMVHIIDGEREYARLYG